VAIYRSLIERRHEYNDAIAIVSPHSRRAMVDRK